MFTLHKCIAKINIKEFLYTLLFLYVALKTEKKPKKIQPSNKMIILFALLLSFFLIIKFNNLKQCLSVLSLRYR